MGLRVLIVDDHPGFRSWARALLELEGYEVVGEAEDGTSAVTAAHALGPDIVLLDIQLPDIDGFEVARELAQDRDGPVVVLISTRDASDYERRIRASGALGFIGKVDLSGASLRALLGE